MIQPEKLNLSPFEREVFGKHVAGKTVGAIARELCVEEDKVRLAITTVWRKDKLAMRGSRAAERANFLNSLGKQRRDG